MRGCQAGSDPGVSHRLRHCQVACETEACIFQKHGRGARGFRISCLFEEQYHVALKNRTKLARPWPRACQIIDNVLLRLICYSFLEHVFQKFCIRNQIKQYFLEQNKLEQQLLTLLLELLFLLQKARMRGGCQGALGKDNKCSFHLGGHFFLTVFVVLCCLTSSIFQWKWSPTWTPKWIPLGAVFRKHEKIDKCVSIAQARTNCTWALVVERPGMKTTWDELKCGFMHCLDSALAFLDVTWCWNILSSNFLLVGNYWDRRIFWLDLFNP